MGDSFSLYELLTNVRNNLKKIQGGFDLYQKECFEQRTSQFFCLELNGEAGELANIEKKEWKGREISPERFDDEAADVLIAILNYANARKIDLAEAVACKLTKIENKRIEMAERGEKY